MREFGKRRKTYTPDEKEVGDMPKSKATSDDVNRFMRAVYGEYADLALASFNEKKALNDAADRIVELEAANAALVEEVKSHIDITTGLDADKERLKKRIRNLRQIRSHARAEAEEWGRKLDEVTRGRDEAMTVRTEVREFACEMEHILKENDWKEHWQNFSVEEMFESVCVEVEELKDAIELGSYDSAEAEAIDVANYAMMVWDLARKAREQKEENDE